MLRGPEGSLHWTIDWYLNETDGVYCLNLKDDPFYEFIKNYIESDYWGTNPTPIGKNKPIGGMHSTKESWNNDPEKTFQRIAEPMSITLRGIPHTLTLSVKHEKAKKSAKKKAKKKTKAKAKKKK